MKLQDFSVEIAEWSRTGERDALLDIRRVVFIEEQGVPETRERDGIDGDCWHVLARDDSGRVIGCGRLTPDRKIGRMAVLPDCRGRGIGAAMLRELVTRARARGWPEVALSAQVSALGFYEQLGFTAIGEEYQDAGLAHRAMFMPLSGTGGEPQLGHDPGTLPASGRAETTAARLQLLSEAHHQVAIHVPVLGLDSYHAAEEIEQLRRIAISGRGALIRILLHDPAAALRIDHRLIALAQRLPSAIKIRTPLEEADLAYIPAFMFNDAGGYLFLPEADRPQGRAARNDRGGLAPLQQHFDAVWERSERASVLQTLDL